MWRTAAPISSMPPFSPSRETIEPLLIRKGPPMVIKTSDYLLLTASFISFLLSVSLWFLVDHDAGVFVGLWVPSILAFGGYVKTLTRRS